MIWRLNIMISFKKMLALSVLALSTFTMGVGISQAKSQAVTIHGDHGKLAAVVQTPDNQKEYPLVIIMHGFTATKERPLLTKLADDLEKDGIASIRFDFNGHGQSEGRFQDMTVPNEIEDAKHVYEYASQLPGVTSISLAGHSQGGVVASMTAGELGTQKVKALALMAPAAVLREDAIRGNLFGTTYDPLNPPAEIPIFKGLKLGANYVKTARDLPIYETASQYQGPAYMLHGTGDTVVPYTYSLRYQRIYFNGQVHLVDGEDHSFTKDTDGAAQAVADFFKKTLKEG